jgi:nucleoside-diphosphate-sugar epimerase
MKILIVGGSSALAKTLLPVLSKFSDVLTAGRSDCEIYIDLSEPIENIRIPEGIDVVVNVAASFSGASFEQIYDTENVNALGVLKLCHACAEAQVKHLVLISSIFVHLDKGSPQFSIYSLSKKHSDELAQLYSDNYKLPLTILRPSQFYGVGAEQLRHQPFLSTIVSKIINGEDVVLYGSNDAKRNFLHVEDLAHIISLVIQHKVLGTFDCPSPNDVTYSEVIEAAIRAFNSGSVAKFESKKPNIPDNIFVIDDSLYQMIGYVPKISISIGMEKEAAFRSTNN